MPLRKKHRSSAMSKRIASLEKKVEPMLKTFEQRQSDYNTPAGGVACSYVTSQYFRMSDLCPTIQSDASSEIEQGVIRLGDKITLKSVSIKGELNTALGTGAENDSRIRLMLVRFIEWDGQNAAVATSQVLQHYPTTVGAGPDPICVQYSPYKNVITASNSADLVKYQVLYDKQFNMQNQSFGGNSQNGWRYKFNIKKTFPKGLVCQYSKALSDEPELNNIVLIALSDSSVTPHPLIKFSSRFKYMDA